MAGGFVEQFPPKEQIKKWEQDQGKITFGSRVKGRIDDMVPGGLRPWSLSRPGYWALAGITVGTLGVFLGPTLTSIVGEDYGLDFELKHPDLMPLLGKEYWKQQWRQGHNSWKRGERLRFFFASKMVLAREATGWDLYKPSTWYSPTKEAPYPRAFVPMCGDSKIVEEMIRMGYEIDAVDCADIPIRRLVESLDTKFGLEDKARGHLHYDDLFDAAFWRKMPIERFDVIWDRQGMSALSGDQRDDYAYLMKRALKPKGVVVLEGCYRTDKVAGNKYKGPPFQFGEKDYDYFFPVEEGFSVKCNDVTDDYIQDFGPEGKVTGKVWKEHHHTTFSCVAWRGFENNKTVQRTGAMKPLTPVEL